jgi:hypothetical protein
MKPAEPLRILRDAAAERGEHGESLSLNDRVVEVRDMTDEEIREQVRGSDLYSPMVKRVMEKFWERCDEIDKARLLRRYDRRD